MKPVTFALTFAVAATPAWALTSREIEAKIEHAKALRKQLLPHENVKPKTMPQSIDEVDPASVKKVKTILYRVPALPQPEPQVIVDNEDFNELDEAAPPQPQPVEPPMVIEPPLPSFNWVDLQAVIAAGSLAFFAWRTYVIFRSRLRLAKPDRRTGVRLRRRLSALTNYLRLGELLPRATAYFRRVEVRPSRDDRREPRLETRNSGPRYGYSEWPFGDGCHQRLGTTSEAPWPHHRPVVRRGA